MGIFDSKRTSARKALYRQLDDADISTLDIYKNGYDAQALEDVLAMPEKKDSFKNDIYNKQLLRIKNGAEKIKLMADAVEAMKEGNISLMVRVADEDWNAFKELTKDTKDLNALKAKAYLYTLREYNNPPGGFDDPSFNRTILFAEKQMREAINGYSALGKKDLCEKAMRAYLEYNHFGHDYVEEGIITDAKTEWQNDLHTGLKDEAFKTRGLAAYNIRKSYSNGLSFEDSFAAIQFHPEDAEREGAIKTLAEKVPYDRAYYGDDLGREEQDQLFDILASHIKTADGKSTPSQHAAMQVLMTQYKDRVEKDMYRFEYDDRCELQKDSKDRLLSTDQFLADVQEELRMGTPHVVIEGFAKGNLLEVIVAQQGWLHGNRGQRNKADLDQVTEIQRNANQKRTTLITDLLPSELEGEQVNQARNTLAESLLKNIAHSVQNNFVGHNGHYDATVAARNAALLSRDVLKTAPATSFAAAQAISNLQQLITMEDASRRLDHDRKVAYVQNRHGMLEQDRDYADHVYDSVAKTEADFAKYNTTLGYGRAMVDALKYDKNDKMKNIVKRIEAGLPEAYVEPEILPRKAPAAVLSV